MRRHCPGIPACAVLRDSPRRATSAAGAWAARFDPALTPSSVRALPGRLPSRSEGGVHGRPSSGCDPDCPCSVCHRRLALLTACVSSMPPPYQRVTTLPVSSDTRSAQWVKRGSTRRARGTFEASPRGGESLWSVNSQPLSRNQPTICSGGLSSGSLIRPASRVCVALGPAPSGNELLRRTRR